MLDKYDAWLIEGKARSVVAVVQRFKNAADVIYLFDPDVYDAMLEDLEDE